MKKRTLLSVGVAMATLGLPVLGAVSAAGNAAPAPAADPAPAVELVTAPLVEVYGYGGRVSTARRPAGRHRRGGRAVVDPRVVRRADPHRAALQRRHHGAAAGHR